jgi:phospholipase/carboxylesterase
MLQWSKLAGETVVIRPELPCKVEPLSWIGPDDELLEKTGLIHCAHIPSSATIAEPVPVVVMLHGWAGNEASMWIFEQTIPDGVAIITPRAPIALEDEAFAWFEYQQNRFQPDPGSLARALNKLEEFLTSLGRFYPVDPTWRVLIGFSQGAMMCNAFVHDHPLEAVGVASLSGAMPPVYDEEPRSNLLAGLPVFIAHGQRDEVIPVEAAQHAREVFASFGADVTYGEYPSAHKMHLEAIKDLKKWLGSFFPGQ